jgi:hypothetical protein
MFAVLLLTTTAASAQNTPQPDASLNACLQISAGKERQVVEIVVQAQTLAKQLEDTRAELAKLKTPAKPDAQ